MQMPSWLVRPLVIVAFCVLWLVVAGCGTGARGLEDEGLEIVRICELPDRAKEGGVVRVRAIYRSGLEESTLVDKDHCLYGLQFWVDFDSDWRASSRRDALRQLKRRPSRTDALVVFRGYYECQGDGTGGYGHLDWYVCQFTVLALERFEGAAPAD